MGWREYAEHIRQAGHERHIRHETSANVPNVPNVPGVPSLDAARRLKSWREALIALDPCEPREGFSMGRWQTLYDTSIWWYEKFGEQAAKDGWATGDVFGIEPALQRYGGLIDRIGDSRGLIMTAASARWRSWGVSAKMCRGGGEWLEPFWSSVSVSPIADGRVK